MTNRNFTPKPTRSRHTHRNHREPRVQTRPVQETCNISVQQDERFCATCGARWGVNNEDFICPKKRK